MRGCYYIYDWGYYTMTLQEEAEDEFNREIISWKIIILGHYDITFVFDYINSINLWWVWPYYFDSISFSKKYYILTPTWDNNYANIPRKPLHLYTEQEEKDLLELLLKLK